MQENYQSQCPRKDECGSCSWSHIPYSKQLKQKLSDINGSFALKGLALECGKILPSPKIDHYRNRMDFVIDFEGKVGLRQKGKWWRVIDNHSCFISDDRIDQHFSQVRSWVQEANLSFYDRKKHTGLLRYAVIRSSRIGESMIIIVTSKPEDSGEEAQIREELEKLAFQTGCSTLIWSINSTTSDVSFGDTLHTISGSGFLYEVIAGRRFRISPHAFFQTNSYAAPLLLETVNEFIGDISQSRMLDLYCGSGFFSVGVGADAREVLGIEILAEAVRDAHVNAELNSLEARYIDAKAEEYDWTSQGFDLVLVDPPRSGMHDQSLAQLLKAAPERIVYVSCNPKHFAREMTQLGEIYAVGKMCALDMFPHTPHVELVTLLERKN